MITVAILEVLDPNSLIIRELYLTSGAHFVVGTNFSLPLITGTFTFTQTILRDSLTESGIALDEGDITLSNLGGELDEYINYGFAGRRIRLYQVDNENSVIDVDQPDFVGRMGVPEFGWEEVVIPLLSRQQDLEIPVSPTTFDQNFDEHDPETYIGGEDSVKGQHKPRLLGRCMSIKPALLNNYLHLYGCNFDRQGEPLAVSTIHGVYSKGGRYTFASNHVTRAGLLSATVAPGTYQTCVSEGLFRLGTVPTGEVTADASSHPANSCTVANLVNYLLTDMGWVAGTDYNQVSLGALDVPVPAGYYVDSNDTVLDVMTLLLQSVGGWGIPNLLGTYTFGKLEGVPSTSVLEVSPDLCLKGSMKRLPRKTQTGEPVSQLDFHHTKFWYTQQESSTLPSLDPNRRTRLASEWATITTHSSDALKTTHPMAEPEEVSTFLCAAPPVTFEDLEFYGQPYTEWWTVSPSDAWTLEPEGLLITTATGVSQTIPTPEVIGESITVRLHYSGGPFTATVNGTAFSITVGNNQIAEVLVDVVTDSLTFSLSKTGGVVVTLHRLEVVRADLVASLEAEAARRHALAAGSQSCYEFVLTLSQAAGVSCGDGVTLVDNRFGLDQGLDFTVISREEDWEAEEVTMTVWRSE
jgi:hypothetical protein